MASAVTNHLVASLNRFSTHAANQLSTALAGQTNLKELVSKLGIAESDLKELAGAATLAVGSAPGNLARGLVEGWVEGRFGKEIWEMLQALTTCTEKLSNELSLGQARFGISLALPLVAMQHSSLPHVECIRELEDLTLVTEGCHWVDFAMGAYGSAAVQGFDKSSISVGIGEKPGVEVIFANLPEQVVTTPGHFVALDRNKKAVVLGIRGTTTLADAVTDAAGESVEISEVPGLQGHKAMLASARNVIDSTRGTLEDELSKNSGFELLVTGHSLGAGTAILCSILLTADPSKKFQRLRCFAFAPPPVVSPLTASAVQNVEIHSFVNRTDVVPRASLANVFHLLEECMAVDQLDLNFLPRFAVMSGDKLNDKEENEKAKQLIMNTVTETQRIRRQEQHQTFPRLFIAGEVYWIEWRGQPGGVEDSKDSNSEPDPIIHRVKAEQFQAMLLRGGSNALKDHLCGAYKSGLEGYRKHLELNAPKSTSCNCVCQ
eukprot:TRINITY_DN58496_c0_g1_i1.p1 TRINITY_DN58496_c0_g1~~TRINITY_DN58496_c0_g1_i1.p1  ORF type:complete len:504 (+),score=85.80 TRINITY_DN58496_c0_g1_i1:44-1513(+)